MMFSIKNFNEKLAIFEGDNQKSKNIETEKNIRLSKRNSEENKKLNVDNDSNKFLNQKKENKDKPVFNKNIITNKHIDQFILERLKLLYNAPKNGEKNDNTRKSSANNIEANSKNKIERIIENFNANAKENELKYINRYIKGIRKKDNIYNMNEKHFPKKLNLKEIFKKMNIDQIASNVNEEKRKEIMKFALDKREDEKTHEPSITPPIIIENYINNDELEVKNETNNHEQNTEKVVKENVDDIKKEEKNTKIEKPKPKNFISSLNDIYNEKRNTIKNNVKIQQKKFEKKKIETPKPENIPQKPNNNEIKNGKVLYANDEENIFLEEKNNFNSKDNSGGSNKFSECFFLASFPVKDGKVIPNSESLPSDCGHNICSKLPAMEPDIIYKYPKDIKNFEINSLAASICFPNGIKLCYEENEKKINVVKNYSSTLTNQTGQMFFIYTYHFYLKMVNEEFINLYTMHPIRYQLTTYQDEFCSVFTDELEEDIVKKLDIYSDLNFKEYVYIPFCLGLISKYPYYPQLKASLESIFASLENDENESYNAYKIISYIIKSVPSPIKNSKVSFPLPYINRFSEIYYPYFKDILLFGNNPMIILENFSNNNIICFLKLILNEQKIIVVGNNMDLISQVILNFISLLYPFEWIHTYIPVMSVKMLKFLQSFLPFFNGMNISLFENARNILSKTEDVFIINVDEDYIELSNNLKKKDKSFRIINYINKNFTAFPKSIENLLLKELKLIKIEIEKYKNYNIFDKQVINNRIRNLFIQMFVEILYDYEKYTYIVDDYPVFNTPSMINDRPKVDKKFYEEITSTQLFQMFIQKSLANEDSNFYFDDKIKEHKELLKRGLNLGEIVNTQAQRMENEYLSFQKINKNYIIKPYLIENYNDYEEEKKKENKPITFKDVNEFIYLQNFNNEKENNMSKENNQKKNKLIINKMINLNNKDDSTSFKQFLIPDNLTKNNNKANFSEDLIDQPNTRQRRSTKVKIIIGERKRTDRYSFMIKNKENELNDDQKEEITDNIKDIMKKVFKSILEDIKEDRELLMDSIKTKFGRDYFINIICSGNKKNLSIKIVENNSFDFLKYIIFSVLLNILKLEENDDNLNSAIKLTKACLYIKTVKNKKEISLSDEIFSQLEDYSLYNNKKFWEKWIEDEMTKEEINIYRNLKKSNKENDMKNDDNYKSYSEHTFQIIDQLFGIMMKLKLSNMFIYSIYSELCGEYIFDDKQFNKLIKEMINGLEYYQKLSKK